MSHDIILMKIKGVGFHIKNITRTFNRTDNYNTR